MHPIRSAAATLALVATLAQPLPVFAQATPADIVVNMRGVEITDVADQISRITGRTLILDPAVKGQVTVTSAEPLTQAGVWELFQSVLRANGFAAVRSGAAWRIVPQANAVRDGGVRSRGVSGQELVTRMIRLSNVPAADAARVVRPLIANFGSVEPVTSPNAIVVTDYADNVRRIEALARQIDGGGGSSFVTIPLTNGSAADVAQAMQGVLGDGEGGARVAADARSNTVIVRGTPSAVAEARRIAQSLDAPGRSTPVTRVFRLAHGDAESVTEVLRGVLGQEQSASNPVARSLSSRTAATARNSPTATLAGLVANNGTGGSAGTNAATGAASTATVGTPGQATETVTPQGFVTPDIAVQPAPDINAIVVRGTPSAVAQIERLLPDLDIRRPQVLIEAAIAEITGEDAEALAIQLGTGGAALTQFGGAGTSFSTAGASLGAILGVLGVPAAAVLGGSTGQGFGANIPIGDNFSILVQALGISSKANLLSTPQITTVDNKLGEFVVAQEVPFVTGSLLTNSAGANPFTTIERKDVGITLRVLPRVNAGDTIRLEVSQEASSIAPTQVSGASDIITNKRAVNTTVLADNGQTIVLGGLTSDDYQRERTQVPGLGNIPIVGELFRGRREQRLKRTLFVFLRPTILRDGADAEAAARARYDRLRTDEALLDDRRSLLLRPPAPRLTLEIDGIY